MVRSFNHVGSVLPLSRMGFSNPFVHAGKHGLANPFLLRGLPTHFCKLRACVRWSWSWSLSCFRGYKKSNPLESLESLRVAQAAAYKAPVAVVQNLVLRAMTRISRGFPALPKSGVLARGFCCSCPEERCHLFNIFKVLPTHELTRVCQPIFIYRGLLEKLERPAPQRCLSSLEKTLDSTVQPQT